MRRTVVAIALAGVTIASAPGAQAETRSVRYVGAVGAYSDLERSIARTPTPAGHLAALGYFTVQPSGGAFTLTVDDEGRLDGQTVPVWMSQHGGWHALQCVPVRVPTKVTGFRSGAQLHVLIAGSGETLAGLDYRVQCSGDATVGMAHVKD